MIEDIAPASLKIRIQLLFEVLLHALINKLLGGIKLTKKDKLQMKACLLFNLFASETLAICQIFIRQASKSFFIMFMICVAVFASEGWYGLEIYDDKKRFIYYNLWFLVFNIFGCGITICGNNSIWSDIMLAVMIILVLILMYFVRSVIIKANEY